MTGSSGRSSAAAIVTARFASSSLVSASTRLAARVAEAGDAEVAGVARVGGEPGHVGVVGLEVEGVDPLLGAVDHDEPAAERVEGPPEQLAGAAVAGDQQERLAQPATLRVKCCSASAWRNARSCSSASSEPIA